MDSRDPSFGRERLPPLPGELQRRRDAGETVTEADILAFYQREYDRLLDLPDETLSQLDEHGPSDHGNEFWTSNCQEQRCVEFRATWKGKC